MASRLLYGMSEEGVRAAPVRRSCIRAPHAVVRDRLHDRARGARWSLPATSTTLADTTVALLVVVFAIVNVTVLVLRRDEVEHDHFVVPVGRPGDRRRRSRSRC